MCAVAKPIELGKWAEMGDGRWEIGDGGRWDGASVAGASVRRWSVRRWPVRQ